MLFPISNFTDTLKNSMGKNKSELHSNRIFLITSSLPKCLRIPTKALKTAKGRHFPNSSQTLKNIRNFTVYVECIYFDDKCNFPNVS